MAYTYSESFYMVLRRRGYRLAARITRTSPSLEAGERVLKLSVKVPESLFTTPTLEATLSIPEEAVSRPLISAEVLDNVRELIEQQTGMEVKISLVEPARVGND